MANTKKTTAGAVAATTTEETKPIVSLEMNYINERTCVVHINSELVGTCTYTGEQEIDSATLFLKVASAVLGDAEVVTDITITKE